MNRYTLEHLVIKNHEYHPSWNTDIRRSIRREYARLVSGLDPVTKKLPQGKDSGLDGLLKD